MPASEYLMTYAPQDAPYRLASDPRGSGNLLDGRSSGRQSFHLFVDGRARQRAFPLQPFGPRQRGGIDHGFWRQCLAQQRQLGSDRLQKGFGRILEQMPAVGNLDGLRRRAVGRSTVACPAVPADHFNLAVGAEPGGNSFTLAVGQICRSRHAVRDRRQCFHNDVRAARRNRQCRSRGDRRRWRRIVAWQSGVRPCGELCVAACPSNTVPPVAPSCGKTQRSGQAAPAAEMPLCQLRQDVGGALAGSGARHAVRAQDPCVGALSQIEPAVFL